jgi:drug/metabolite transporter (DMT)-like permease
MPEKISGLPAHPLIIHIPVMLGPLVGLLCILMLVPKLRPKILPWTAAFGVLFALSTIIAVISGQNFAKAIQVGSAIREHAEAAKTLRLLAIILAAVLVAYWLAAKRLGSRAMIAGALVVAALGVAETAYTVKTGHAGAKVVWGGFGS